MTETKDSASHQSDSDDQHFQHYSLKHRVVSWFSRNIFDNYTYTVHHGLLRGLKRKGGLGWLPEFMSGSIETAEIRFWRGLNLDGLTVYDVGAFEGLLSVFFASRARQVVSYEPNPRNHARLLENLRLNGLTNVTVRNMGVGEAPAELQMVWDPSMPGGASLESNTADNLLKTVRSAKTVSISITTLDSDRAALHLPAPDLVKIDIEGWELEALKGARETLTTHHPALYLEMHGETMREKKQKVAAIVAFLNEIGYTEIRHVETDQAITASNSSVASEGHLYAPASASQVNPKLPRHASSALPGSASV